MDGRAQYTKTRAGVTIAYHAHGTGPALLTVPSVPVSNLEMELELPGSRLHAQRVGRYRTLVRFDLHGFGQSQRDATDFSLEACADDIEAVVDRLGFETFAMDATGLATPIALTFAARSPQRVTQLVLSRAFSRLEEFAGPSLAAIVTLAEEDWTMTSETLARVALGWGEHELAASVAAIIRGSTTPRSLLTFFEQASTWDVSPILPLVTCPTLLIAHREGASAIFVEPTRRIAASLPNARLVEVGAGDEMQLVPAATWGFLGVPELAVPPSPRPRLTLVLFADIADSARLTEELGDEQFRAKARRLDAALRSVIEEHNGTVIEGKLLGDGVLATFQSAAEGVRGATALIAAGSGVGLPLHVGLHAGDVIQEADNVFGGAVNIAARISALSAPDEVLVSDVVRALARTSAGVTFEDRGEHALKGIAEPQRVFAVRHT